MSRAAQEMQRLVNEMRKAQKRGGRRAVTDEPDRPDDVGEQAERVEDGPAEGQDERPADQGNVTDEQTRAPETAVGSEQEQTMAKKAKGTKEAVKAKGARKQAAPKTPKAASTRRPRQKEAPDGGIKKVEASGSTYLVLTFENSVAVTLTPTGNREANRDAVVKALRALLK